MNKKARLKKYAAGIAGITSLTPSAQASVVYWNPTDVTLAIGDSASFDMLTGVVTSGGSATASAFWLNNNSADYVYMIRTTNLADPVIGGDQMARLSDGDTIGPAQTFSGSTWVYFDYFNSSGFPWNTGTDGTTGFVGLRFSDGSGIHYGWAQFTYNDISNTLVLQDFAYESNANTAILAGAGAVPEPGSLLLLASGGVLAARRRRRAA